MSLGAQENEVYDNDIIDSTRYGIFFFRGSDEAEVCAFRSHVAGVLIVLSRTAVKCLVRKECVPQRTLLSRCCVMAQAKPII